MEEQKTEVKKNRTPTVEEARKTLTDARQEVRDEKHRQDDLFVNLLMGM